MEARMLDIKTDTLIAVAEEKKFTAAAEKLSLTQPAVSHQIGKLEEELGCKLFLRGNGEFRLTPEGEIAVKYARRFKAMYAKMLTEIDDCGKNLTKVRIGITHTAESSIIAEALAKCGSSESGVLITIITDTIKNLYSMLENYELDIAIVEDKPTNPGLYSVMLDTDYLVCVMSNNNPLAKQSMVTLGEIKRQRMILRLPSSATRMLFEATLESLGESIDSFNVVLEVDNIATIKNLIRKDFGVSILPRSACLDELGKKKITALPIENLSMVRETNIVYKKDFSHTRILKDITRAYKDIERKE